METILHVAIDSFAIQAERLRCPKLNGRPLALAPSDSPRPRVVSASREARAAGIVPGTPLVVARKLCRDLIALPPDRDLYAGLSDSIREQLSPFAPFAEEERAPGGPPGRFALNLTGVARTHAAARDRAIEAGRDVERAFRLHPTLGIAATRLVSRVAATVLAPDGNLLDVAPGSEVAFLAPLAVRVLPSSRERATGERLDLLNARLVRDVQAWSPEQLRAAFAGPVAVALWREARGLDGALRRAAAPPRVAIAEETLAMETNDRRVLAARLERLAVEIGTGLRWRGATADALALSVLYADSREGSARQALVPVTASEIALHDAVLSLLDRAVTRRVRVTRLRLEAHESPPRAEQLCLWHNAASEGRGMPEGTVSFASRVPDGIPLPSLFTSSQADRGVALDRGAALERALDRVRNRFGTEALVPAAWMAHGLVVRSPARP